MVFQLNITSRAEQNLAEILDYLQNRVGIFGNPQAAKNFLREYETALNILSKNATGHNFCEEEYLYKSHYRKLHFRKMKYKIFYRVEGDIVTIDLITHDSQDYTELL